MKENPDGVQSLPFKLSRRRSITVSPQDLVTSSFVDPERQFPLVLCAAGGDIGLIDWARAHLNLIQSHLLRYGAVLFRGFQRISTDEFRRFVEVISGPALTYREQTSPRTHVTDNVYTSTDYPSDQVILPHNENSYAITFPQKLFLWCETAPRDGGQTPLGDTRRILAAIPRKILDEFVEKGWMYVRNFAPNLGVSWQTAFQTDDPARVEEYCGNAAIECEWTRRGLRTRQRRPAVIRHPHSDEFAWFNHAVFFHVSRMETALREGMLRQYDHEDLPNNTYFGDGSPIPDDVVRQLHEVYEKEMVAFDWQHGDVVLIDNVLAAHARASFKGPRRILFAMAELYTRTDLVRLRGGV